ncbi:ANTAR domain-containing protein [Streptomyces sp. NPDC093591]|uniref:ANTAR domain-containing protein n=1 Tax=Streptomyces sp. NPDC093591 TaxID=3366044 RepID=UPI0038262488
MTAIHPDGDRITVKVGGELDLDSSERLRGVLREALSRSVHGIDLDLGGVTFCDCSALNILLTLRRRALEQAKTITIQHASTEVDRLLALTGTQPLFARPGPDGQGAPVQYVQDTEPQEMETQGMQTRDMETAEDADYDLRIEVAQLRRAMQTRPTIDLARGILMASFSLSSEEAWTVLVAASQNTNTKLHSLAGDLVTAVKGDALPDAVQEQLSSAVARVNSGVGTTGGAAEGQEPAQAAD